MTREKFIEDLEMEYPGIVYQEEILDEYLKMAQEMNAEPGNTEENADIHMFAEYWATSY